MSDQTPTIEAETPCPICGLKKQTVTDIISRLHGELYQAQEKNRRLAELLVEKGVQP